MVAGAAPDAVLTVGDNAYGSAGRDQAVGQYYHSFIGATAALRRRQSHQPVLPGARQPRHQRRQPDWRATWASAARGRDLVAAAVRERALLRRRARPGARLLHRQRPSSPPGSPQRRRPRPPGCATAWPPRRRRGTSSCSTTPPSPRRAGTAATPPSNGPSRAWGADLVLNGHDHPTSGSSDDDRDGTPSPTSWTARRPGAHGFTTVTRGRQPGPLA